MAGDASSQALLGVQTSLGVQVVFVRIEPLHGLIAGLKFFAAHKNDVVAGKFCDGCVGIADGRGQRHESEATWLENKFSKCVFSDLNISRLQGFRQQGALQSGVFLAVQRIPESITGGASDFPIGIGYHYFCQFHQGRLADRRQSVQNFHADFAIGMCEQSAGLGDRLLLVSAGQEFAYVSGQIGSFVDQAGLFIDLAQFFVTQGAW